MENQETNHESREAVIFALEQIAKELGVNVPETITSLQTEILEQPRPDQEFDQLVDKWVNLAEQSLSTDFQENDPDAGFKIDIGISIGQAIIYLKASRLEEALSIIEYATDKAYQAGYADTVQRLLTVPFPKPE